MLSFIHSKLCEAVVAWNTMPNELVEMFREVCIAGYLLILLDWPAYSHII